MATLSFPIWDLLCHGMAREEGDTPIYRTPCILWCCHVSIFYALFLGFSPSLSYHTNIFPLKNSTLLKGSWWCLEGGGWISEPEKLDKFFEIISPVGTSDAVKEVPTLTRYERDSKLNMKSKKPIWIKSSPMSRRYPCKWSRALDLLNEVDRDKTRLGQQEQVMNKQSSDTTNLFPKFTPTKDATSPLRSS